MKNLRPPTNRLRKTNLRQTSDPKKTPASSAGLPRTGTTSGGVEFEIERAKGDADEVIDPEQLNLF